MGVARLHQVVALEVPLRGIGAGAVGFHVHRLLAGVDAHLPVAAVALEDEHAVIPHELIALSLSAEVVPVRVEVELVIARVFLDPGFEEAPGDIPVEALRAADFAADALLNGLEEPFQGAV